jgi:hypothetical protein
MAEKTIMGRLGIGLQDKSVEVIDIADLSCTLSGIPRYNKDGKEEWNDDLRAYGFSSQSTKKVIMVMGTIDELRERFHSLVVALQPDWVREVEDLIDEDAESLAEDIRLAKEQCDEKEFTDEELQSVYDGHDWCDIAENSDEVAELVKQKAQEILEEEQKAEELREEE